MTTAPLDGAHQAAHSLPTALRTLDLAIHQQEFVANRAGSAKLTLTFEVPSSLPLHFHLEGEAAQAALALLPALSAAQVEDARALVRTLAERVNASLGQP